MIDENVCNDFEVNFCKVLVKTSAVNDIYEKYEEPLIDVVSEEDNVKLLVQGRCMEQQISIHINKNKDGITICREECSKKKDADVTACNDVCSRNISLNLKELQIENMLFVVSKCNNNNVLEINIPKIKQEKLQ